MNLEKLFHLKENHTDVRTEVMAGITTFMTNTYLLVFQKMKKSISESLTNGTKDVLFLRADKGLQMHLI